MLDEIFICCALHVADFLEHENWNSLGENKEILTKKWKKETHYI